MKKISLILIAITVAFAFACTSNNNGNGNVTANKNATTRAGSDSTANEQIAVGTEKSVTITIADDPSNPGKCVITFLPGSDPVHISKSKKEKIKWCIVNSSSSASGATVTISGFASSDPSKKNPFGDGSNADNTFDITSSDYDCKVKTKDAASGDVGVSYKYTITVKVSGDEKCILDPQVIIDD